jgi:hypothetical protein
MLDKIGYLPREKLQLAHDTRQNRLSPPRKAPIGPRCSTKSVISLAKSSNWLTILERIGYLPREKLQSAHDARKNRLSPSPFRNSPFAPFREPIIENGIEIPMQMPRMPYFGVGKSGLRWRQDRARKKIKALTIGGREGGFAFGISFAFGREEVHSYRAAAGEERTTIHSNKEGIYSCEHNESRSVSSLWRYSR